MTAYERIRDRTIRRAVYLERYKTGLFQRILEGVDRDGFDAAISETVKQIARMNRLSRRRLTGEAGRLAITNLVRSQRSILRTAYATARKDLTSELAKFSVKEAQWIRGAVTQSLPIAVDLSTPPTATLRALVTQQPAHGKLIAESFQEMGSAATRRIAQATRLGIAQGQPADKIVRTLTGSTRTPGAFDIDRRALNANIRTIASDTSARARESTFEEMDVVAKVQFLATLDNRTTDICAGLDGKVYEKGEGPRPPMHFNCRSTVVPVLKSWKEMGLDFKELGPTKRAQMPGTKGQADSKTTYGEWLKKQDKPFQDDILGKKRAQLFRDGKVEIDQFVDYSRNPPRRYRLDELPD